MAAIYRKTASGQAEVGSKAHHLPPRARSLLIMVDGQRDAETLRGMLGPAVDEGIELLLREGLIEQSGSTSPAKAPVSAPPAAAARPPAPSAAAAPSFEETRRAAARAVTEALGPMADSVAMRIERAKTPADLQSALQVAAGAIADISTSARAEAFRQRFLPE